MVVVGSIGMEAGTVEGVGDRSETMATTVCVMSARGGEGCMRCQPGDSVGLPRRPHVVRMLRRASTRHA